MRQVVSWINWNFPFPPLRFPFAISTLPPVFKAVLTHLLFAFRWEEGKCRCSNALKSALTYRSFTLYAIGKVSGLRIFQVQCQYVNAQSSSQDIEKYPSNEGSKWDTQTEMVFQWDIYIFTYIAQKVSHRFDFKLETNWTSVLCP